MIQSTPVMPQTLPAARSLSLPSTAWAYSNGVHNVPPPSGSPPPPAATLAARALRPARRGRAALARGGRLRRRQARARRGVGGAPVGGRVGARGLRLDARAALRRRAQARQLEALRAHLPRGRRDGDAAQGRDGQPAGGGGRRLRPAGRHADTDLRPPARHRPPADGRGGGRRRGRLARGRSCSPACARARSSRARRRCPSAATSSPATARRWPRAPTGSRTSGRWPPRSRAGSAPRHPSAPTSSPAAACPRARRSA